MPIESIDNRRLYRQIADQIIRLIESGEYKPGERLPAERVLAERLTVSRPTVREALIALEVEGRVEIRGGSGVFVLNRQEKQASETPPANSATPAPGPFDVLFARDLIEPDIAALAAKNASPAHDSQIGFFDLLLFELCGGFRANVLIEREEQHTGGAAIETMHRMHMLTDLVAQDLHGEAGFMTVKEGTVDQQSRRLVHRDQVLVAMDDWKLLLH